MKMINVKRPIEVVEFHLEEAPDHPWMLVDKFDQPLIQISDWLVAMCMKEKINNSKGSVCLELEQIEVIKRLEKRMKDSLVKDEKNVTPNDPNLYPEDFNIDPEKAKYVQKKEIDAGEAPEDAYDKPKEDEPQADTEH